MHMTSVGSSQSVILIHVNVLTRVFLHAAVFAAKHPALMFGGERESALCNNSVKN